mgnify:CR=1 FL=1
MKGHLLLVSALFAALILTAAPASAPMQASEPTATTAAPVAQATETPTIEAAVSDPLMTASSASAS